MKCLCGHAAHNHIHTAGICAGTIDGAKPCGCDAYEPVVQKEVAPELGVDTPGEAQ